MDQMSQQIDSTVVYIGIDCVLDICIDSCIDSCVHWLYGLCTLIAVYIDYISSDLIDFSDCN